MRVLVVDDDQDTVASTAEVLALHGFAATEAHDGAQALGLVGPQRPDVILTDIRMPGVGGGELVRRVRALGCEPRPMLVAVTGCGEAEQQEAGVAGFDLVLTKPVAPAVLVGLLRRVERAVC